ncbi:hypothetical protein [Mycolicibacterium lutetiense]
MRPYLTAGVVLVGAAAIVASPVGPSIPDVHVPALSSSSAAVELTASTDPISAWINVFGKTFNNVSQIGGAVIADPAPILQQVIANQLGYAQTLGTGVATIPPALIKWATVTVPAALQLASDKVAADDIVGAATAISNAIGGFLAVPGGMFSALPIPGNMTDNLTNAMHAFMNLSTMLSLVSGVLNPIQATVFAAGDSGQAYVDAMKAGDQAAAVTALINTPAALADAFLNGIAKTRVPGVPGGHSAFNGLLTFNANPSQGGLVQALLVGVPQAIAAAITPPVAPPAALTEVSSVPEATARTVTLDTPSAPAVETLKRAVQPESELSTAIAATAEVSGTDESMPAAAAVAESATPSESVTVKDGNKTVPGEVKTSLNAADDSATTTSTQRTKPSVKSLRDHIKSSLGKVGLKKRSGDKAATSKGGAGSTSGSSDGGDH